MRSDDQPTQPLTDAELAAIRGGLSDLDIVESGIVGLKGRYGVHYFNDHLGNMTGDLAQLLAEVDRLRAENDSTFADLLHYSHLHWEDCPLDEEDCYLCEGYERIEANARDRKAAHGE